MNLEDLFLKYNKSAYLFNNIGEYNISRKVIDLYNFSEREAEIKLEIAT
jgi:hypothetical protein